MSYGLPKYLKTFFVLNRCRFIKFITGALKNSVALVTSEISYRYENTKHLIWL